VNRFNFFKKAEKITLSDTTIEKVLSPYVAQNIENILVEKLQKLAEEMAHEVMKKYEVAQVFCEEAEREIGDGKSFMLILEMKPKVDNKKKKGGEK